MERERLNKLIAITLLMTLTMFQILNAICGIVIAVNENVSIEFEVEKIDISTMEATEKYQIENGGIIKFKIDSYDSNTIKDGKIHVEDPNFTINQEKLNMNIVENVDITNNDIMLKPFTGRIEIEVSVEFCKKEKITIDYFNKETKFTFSAKEVMSNEEEIEINQESTTNIQWYGNLENNQINQEFLQFSGMYKNKYTVLEQIVTVETPNNILPKIDEQIEVDIPNLNISEEKKPSQILVRCNGKEIESQNEEEKIKFKNPDLISIDEDQMQINWNTGIDTYKIIYMYEEDLGTIQNVSTNGNVTTRYAICENDITADILPETISVKEAEPEVDIEFETTGEVSNEYLALETNQKVYMQEIANLTITERYGINKINAEIGNISFLNQNGVETESNISLEKTYFNKEKYLEIYGNTPITVLDNLGSQNTIDVNTIEADENGDITINYQEGVKKANIIIETQPQKEGTLQIKTSKYFSGNIEIPAETVKTFTTLRNKLKIQINNNVKEVTIEKTADINIKTPEIVAQTQMNPAKLNANSVNRNVEITTILDTKNIANALYKNSEIKFVFPKQIKSVEPNSIRLLYDQEIAIKKAGKTINNDGCIEIILNLEGEQTDYKEQTDENAMILINTNIELYQDIPSFTETIKIIISNEECETKTFEVKFEGEEKTGLFSYSKLEINNDKTIETLGTEEVDLSEDDVEKTAKRTVAIINNNDFEVQNVTIEGTISGTNENEIRLNYLGELQADKQVQILYTTDENNENWVENVDNFSEVKKFKINVGNMEPCEVLKLTYNIKIPEKIGNNLRGYVKDDIKYEINGQTIEELNQVKFFTPEQYVQMFAIQVDQANLAQGLNLQYKATTGNTEIKEGDEIYEGQVISYHVKITNNTGEKIQGVYFTATQENAVFYNYIKRKGTDTVTEGDLYNVEYKEDEQCQEYRPVEIKMYPETDGCVDYAKDLSPNESIELDYQFTVKKLTDTNITQGNIKLYAEGVEVQNYDTYKNTIKDAKIKVSVLSTGTLNEQLYGGMSYSAIIKAENLTNQNLSNIDLDTYISGLKYDSFSQGDDEHSVSVTKAEDNDEKITIKIPELKPSESISTILFFTIKDVDITKESAQTTIFTETSIGNEKFLSNILKNNIVQNKANITVTYTGSQTKEEYKTGDEVEFILDIKGDSAIVVPLSIDITIPNASVVNSVFMTVNDSEQKLEKVGQKVSITKVELAKKGQIKIVIKATIDELRSEDKKIESTAIVSGGAQQFVKTVTYSLKNVEDIEAGEDLGDDEDDENNEENGNNGNGGQGENSTKTSTISGQAWIDNNQNGQKDSEDGGIPGLKVRLISSKGEQISETATNDSGMYEFSGISSGEYLVVVSYNANEYKPTIYKKDSVSNDYNSDMVAKILNGEIVAATDIISLNNEKIKNIDVGFVKNKTFDFSLDKSVTQITLVNGTQNTVKQYKDSKLAKAEIDKKKIDNTTIYIQYKIKVTNEGDIQGTVSEIVDYLPEDVTFENEKNKGWYKGNDGNIHTTSLSNEKINPGESRELTLILTKNKTSNIGITTNIAEIAKTTNENNLQDIDSKENNKKDGEDDMSKAEAIIGVKTGAITIIGIILAIMIMAGVAVYYIRRVVEHE